ncbi:MAG: nucleotidyltransferase domain-containing protein [Elusimicrobiota bacterium]|nr:nucleotidyltransferase domain-containing protein [Elusimicrobiota bacterium]
MKKNLLFTTNDQKALNFFLEHPHKDFVEADVGRFTKISRSGVNYALKNLISAGYLFLNKAGKTHLYILSHKNPIVKQLKVLKTISQITDLVEKLKPLSSKIILFGSSCRGENTSDSDLDLLIISHSEAGVKEVVGKQKTKRKIQAVVRTELKFSEMKRTDSDFYEQVNKGITLWERTDESGI